MSWWDSLSIPDPFIVLWNLMYQCAFVQTRSSGKVWWNRSSVTQILSASSYWVQLRTCENRNERGLSPEDLPADHPGSSYQVYPLLAVGNCWGWAWVCVCDETTLVLLPDGVVLSQRVETPGGQMGCLKRAEVPWQGLHGLKPQAGGCMKVFF